MSCLSTLHALSVDAWMDECMGRQYKNDCCTSEWVHVSKHADRLPAWTVDCRSSYWTADQNSGLQIKAVNLCCCRVMHCTHGKLAAPSPAHTWTMTRASTRSLREHTAWKTARPSPSCLDQTGVSLLSCSVLGTLPLSLRMCPCLCLSECVPIEILTIAYQCPGVWTLCAHSVSTVCHTVCQQPCLGPCLNNVGYCIHV